jgi:hypothetical protein
VKPLAKLKRKTVYFVKTAHARLDNDNIKTLVSNAMLSCTADAAAQPYTSQLHANCCRWRMES